MKELKKDWVPRYASKLVAVSLAGAMTLFPIVTFADSEEPIDVADTPVVTDVSQKPSAGPEESSDIEQAAENPSNETLGEPEISPIADGNWQEEDSGIEEDTDTETLIPAPWEPSENSDAASCEKNGLDVKYQEAVNRARASKRGRSVNIYDLKIPVSEEANLAMLLSVYADDVTVVLSDDGLYIAEIYLGAAEEADEDEEVFVASENNNVVVELAEEEVSDPDSFVSISEETNVRHSVPAESEQPVEEPVGFFFSCIVLFAGAGKYFVNFIM